MLGAEKEGGGKGVLAKVGGELRFCDIMGARGKGEAGVFSVSDAIERGKEDGRVKRSFGNPFIRKLLVPTDRSSPGKWW